MNALKAYAAAVVAAITQVPLPDDAPFWLRLLLAGITGGVVWLTPPALGVKTPPAERS